MIVNDNSTHLQHHIYIYIYIYIYKMIVFLTSHLQQVMLKTSGGEV